MKEKIKLESEDINQNRVHILKEQFPEAFTENKIDFDKLRASLGDIVEEGKERYLFTWAGKSDAIKLLQIPTRGTLKPVRGESIDFNETRNIFIEGENLEVLKLLYKSYFGKVKLYLKLPSWFTVSTPVGEYNPDWAIVMDNPENSGKPLLYLVRETKSTKNLDELRPDEKRKIKCGKVHFKEALDVDYKVVVTANELP